MMLFIRSDIPLQLLSVDIDSGIVFVELNFRKKKWLLHCYFKPKSSNIESHLTRPYVRKRNT